MRGEGCEMGEYAWEGRIQKVSGPAAPPDDHTMVRLAQLPAGCAGDASPPIEVTISIGGVPVAGHATGSW